MSQTLRIVNFGELNIKERGNLAADAAVAATSLTVNYTDNFAVGDFLYIGRLGSESGEVSAIATIPDADTVTVAALTKPHLRFDDIQTLFGDQIKIYRASN